jgi:twinkle protein
MTRFADIARLLADRAQDVAQMLLPHGKRKGREWTAGSTSGDPGDSLKVCLTGTKAGVWKDFATGEGGDLLDLWAATRRIDNKQAFTEAKSYLGVKDDKQQVRPARQKPFVKPDSNGLCKLTSDTAAYKYLVDRRGITQLAIDAFDIKTGDKGNKIVFSVYSAQGEHTALKHLAIERDEKGKKKTWASKDSRWHLYGWQAMSGNTRSVVITEGEIDCMTVWQWGFSALSIPMGTNNDDWIDLDYDELERFDEIILCFDSDEAGQAVVEDVARRLGIERVKILVLPNKDANECLQKGMKAEQFAACIAKARELKPEELKSPREFESEVSEEFFPVAGVPAGTPSFIEKFDWRIRPCELTIWTGFSGHGKSPAILQSLVHDMSLGEKALIISLELRPQKSLAMMCRQALGAKPTPKTLDVALNWLEGKCWLLDKTGSMPWRELLPIMRYSVRRFGISRIVIDSLLLLGVSGDDYDQQKKCVEALVTFAANERCHIHLVAHSKKLEDESRLPSKFDVKGSGDITDLCQNGVTIWRNLKKLQGSDDPMKQAELDTQPDIQLKMWKQRETGELPFTNGWLCKEGFQLLRDKYLKAKCYIEQGELNDKVEQQEYVVF